MDTALYAEGRFRVIHKMVPLAVRSSFRDSVLNSSAGISEESRNAMARYRRPYSGTI
jgi:hypothetical protein